MSAGELLFDLPVSDMPFTLNERLGVRMAHSGFSQALNMAEPYWSFDLRTPWLTKDQFRSGSAWMTRRRGAAITFTAWRQSRADPAVAVPSDAGLTVSDWNRANSTLSFSGTGAWTATEGDMLSYITAAGGYWLGMAMETKAAVSGDMTDLAVYPPPFEPHATTANPRRIKALGEFRLRMPVESPIERVDERYISFSADQIIRG